MGLAGQTAAHILKPGILKPAVDPLDKPATSQPRVLVVDDDWGVRETLRLLLIAAGYAASEAQNGIQALQQIQKETPTLLLCDLEMPKMSGFELLPIVRRQFPGVALIAMSGSYGDGSVPEGVMADAFYCKGRQKPPDLFRMVADVIQRSCQAQHH